jgi:hypothetical protein
MFDFLGWKTLYSDENMVGVGCEKDSSLWFCAGLKDLGNDYDGIGMNHLGISVEKQSDVDRMVDYLAQHNIKALFDTPRHRPEFSNPDSTYYQVMFESPDKILFEVVYTGPKE